MTSVPICRPSLQTNMAHHSGCECTSCHTARSPSFLLTSRAQHGYCTSSARSIAAALSEHRRVLRAAFSANGGVEVDTQGDAFFSAFVRASDAVAAAEAIQRQHALGPIRVRIGLHTGEPVRTEEGYVGIDVHRGARVCASAHGGQVLLSQPTRDLVDVDVRDLGEHRLKDLLEPQRLFQLGGEEFPPLKTLDWTNLPVQATPLIGRERELTAAVVLLREHRLMTLVGPPGTGKTRLALQLAAEVADEFEHVWWVALQHIRDPDLVEPTIAQIVGARSDLAGYLRDRRALILLDNVEHVIELRAPPGRARCRLEQPEAAGHEPRAAAPDARAAVSGAAVARATTHSLSSVSARAPSAPASQQTAPWPRSAAASTAYHLRSNWPRRASRC